MLTLEVLFSLVGDWLLSAVQLWEPRLADHLVPVQLRVGLAEMRF